MSRSVLAPLRVIVAMVVLVAGLAGCGGAEPAERTESSHSSFRLRIETTASDVKTKLLAVKGQSETVDDGSGELTITVDKVEGESATISTSELMTPSDGSASPTDEFTVSKGTPVSFSSGDGTWTVTFEELTVE